MADATIYLGEHLSGLIEPLPIRATDNGDGSYSLATDSITDATGTVTHVQPAGVACNNTTSVTALAASATRKYALFVNDSVNTIYLDTTGTDAVANHGVRLNAGGGSDRKSTRRN